MKRCSKCKADKLAKDFFKSYIEGMFKDGMSWSNHGEWHIDHIVPVSWFVKNHQDPYVCNHYTNLQPLWKHENLAKGDA